MISLLEYIINENNKIDLSSLGQIIFDLDESSLSLLNNSDRQLITEGYVFEMSKYFDKTSSNKQHARLVWTSRNNEVLKLTSHAEDRLNRPKEQGGDGEPIDIQEIINMFIYSWRFIIKMYKEGYLKRDNLGNDKWTIQCKCYLEGSEQNLCVSGARPNDKFLWAIWEIFESSKGQLNVKVITLFRGERLNHKRNQERIVIASNGFVKQKLPFNNKEKTIENIGEAQNFLIKGHTKKQNKFRYFPEIKEELEILITKRIKEKGPDVDLNDIDISKVNDLSFVFKGCKTFKGDISRWDVSHVTDMYEMFCDCFEFNCDISNWDIRKVRDFQFMFKNCKNLNKDYFEAWGDKIQPSTEMSNMFYKSNLDGNEPSWW